MIFPLVIESVDNPYFPVTSGTYQTVDLMFHRNWYIRMSELCSPLGFANAINDGILKTGLLNEYIDSSRGKSINVNQPMRIQFISTPTLIVTISMDLLIGYKMEATS